MFIISTWYSKWKVFEEVDTFKGKNIQYNKLSNKLYIYYISFWGRHNPKDIFFLLRHNSTYHRTTCRTYILTHPDVNISIILKALKSSGKTERRLFFSNQSVQHGYICTQNTLFFSFIIYLSINTLYLSKIIQDWDEVSTWSSVRWALGSYSFRILFIHKV